MIRYQLTVLLLLLTLSACVQSEYNTVTPSVGSQKVLRVGITTNAPPMAYREGERVTGLEAEFARGLAKFTGRTIRFVELKWDEQIPALLAGKTDIIMSSMTITEARSYRISFCDPYMISGQVSLVRLSEMNRFINGFTDLLNPAVTTGTVKGTTGDLFVEKNIAGGKRKRFNTPEKGIKALLNNQIDAFVYDLPMNFYFAAKYEGSGLAPVTIPFTREQIAWGVRKDDSALRQEANTYLARLKEEGQLKKMLVHWIPFFKNVFNR